MGLIGYKTQPEELVQFKKQLLANNKVLAKQTVSPAITALIKSNTKLIKQIETIYPSL